MSSYAERRDDLLADIVGKGFEGWQQSLVDEFVAECEQAAWLTAWDAEWRAQDSGARAAIYLQKSLTDTERVVTQRALLERAEAALAPIAACEPFSISESDEAAAVVIAIRAAREGQQQYGCHVDLEPGTQPDACVFDSGDIEDCVHARGLHADGKGKAQCPHWKPITEGQR